MVKIRMPLATAVHWPGSRLVEIWNNLPRVRQIAKFTDRQTGVQRIWKAIQRLEPHGGPHAASGGDKTGSRARVASPSEQPAVARADTKAARVIALLETACWRDAQSHYDPDRLAIP